MIQSSLPSADRKKHPLIRGVLALASALPELPVIIITAFGGPDVEAQALRLGAFAFLEKPIAAAQLIEVVKRALARSPTREA